MVEIDTSEFVVLAVLLLPSIAFVIYLWFNFSKAPSVKEFFFILLLSIVSIPAISLVMFILFFAGELVYSRFSGHGF